MAFNKIGYVGQKQLPVAANFAQNSTVSGLNTQQQLYGQWQPIALAPAQAFIIPSGVWTVAAGPYSDIQYFDSVSGFWRNFTAFDTPVPIQSDGTNFRVANLSGCPVGAIVTAGGANAANVAGYYPAGSNSSYTCVASAGGSTWNMWVGGMVNTSPTITAGGTGYTVAPTLMVLPPQSQGTTPFIPATMTCTISGGAINAVTVTNQGAGYVAAPTVVVLNNFTDTTGAGAVITTALANTTSVSAIVMATPGTVRTAVPTLTVTTPGGSPTATAVMNFSITNAGTGTVTAGSGYTNGYQLYSIGGTVTTAPAWTNPAIETQIVTPNQPIIYSASTTVLGLNNASTVFVYGGIGFQLAPSLQGVGLASTGFITAPTVGGQNDYCYIQAF